MNHLNDPDRGYAPPEIGAGRRFKPVDKLHGTRPGAVHLALDRTGIQPRGEKEGIGAGRKRADYRSDTPFRDHPGSAGHFRYEAECQSSACESERRLF